MSSVDWTLDAKTGRDILIIVFFILGGLAFLSLFHLAGRLGDLYFRFIYSYLGIISYIFPFIIVSLGIELIREEDDEIHLTPLLAALLGMVLLASLFTPFGGIVGKFVLATFTGYLGAVGAYLLVFALFVTSFSLATGISVFKIIPAVKGAFGKLDFNFRLPKAKVFTLSGRRPEKQTAPSPSVYKTDKTWEYPPVDLLEVSNTKASAGNIGKNLEVIGKTLKDFNIKVSMQEVNIGPTVTQYTLKPEEGVKLSAITARTNDLSLALAAHPIRVEAPIPGKAAVGVEVPNKTAAIVTLRDLLESNEMKESKNPLQIGLGRDVSGQPISIDLAKMPHLLIAGSTGSGKSVCINSIITTFIMRNSPSDLRLLLVDPKRVEFTLYNGIPHLIAPVVCDADKTVSSLKWMVGEMERRYKVLSEVHKRSINDYNDSDPPDGKMPFIIVIVDELADLMSQAANEIEATIVRLAQMARAVGIHLIVATQRPSVNVITGLIKANINARIAFAVASQIDSRTILDVSGAEKLLGNGDMLYIGGETVKPKRVQGVYASDKDVKVITDFLKSKSGDVSYDESILSFRPQSKLSEGGNSAGEDDLYDEARELVIQSGKASASLLQRRLRVGYARAARLLDLLEQDGVIGPPDGAKPRDVLVDSLDSISDYGDK